MKGTQKIFASICLILLSLICLASCLTDTDAHKSTEKPDSSQITSQPSETDEETTPNETSSEETTADLPEDPNAGLTKAPELTIADMNGKAVKLSDFFGKPIVLNFWASWCGPCKNEFPAFAEVCREYNGEVIFLFVNCFDGATETMRTVQNFINGNGYSDLPIYLDKTGARQAYGVSAIPFTFFINEDGYIVNSLNTSISKDRLLSEIAKIYTPAT